MFRPDWTDRLIGRGFRAILQCALLMAVAAFSPVQAAELALAGFSFAGDFKSAADRFPHSFSVFQEANAHASEGKALSKLIQDRTRAVSNPAFEWMPADTLSNLSNDQALMAALVLTGETVSTEVFGAYYKTFVNLRGNALIFDYKSKRVVRSYPISVVVFDATRSRPSEQDIRAFVKNLMLREDGNGLITQFTRRMGAATLPVPGTRTIQVKNVGVAAEALAVMPEALRKESRIVETMLADSFAAILAAKLGVSMLPSGVGHTLGTMALRLENGDDLTLKIGEGDYLFDLKLNKFARIKSGENTLGASYVYGSYASIHFYEPTQQTDYLNTDLKNGEVKLVPAGQVSTEDFPAYEAALRGMFLKLADALQQPDAKWIMSAASSKDITRQLELTRDILKACK